MAPFDPAHVKMCIIFRCLPIYGSSIYMQLREKESLKILFNETFLGFTNAPPCTHNGELF
jgi:hypothetical protein